MTNGRTPILWHKKTFAQYPDLCRVKLIRNVFMIRFLEDEQKKCAASVGHWPDEAGTRPVREQNGLRPVRIVHRGLWAKINIFKSVSALSQRCKEE
ncbi:hypothetical protein DdX_19639 [Ditylenchus destructor]|uniref:Uncharacterized protein n=1 Tax=Ditylenchus destructor TaxID=166010 RepID=A0AAD4MHE8_9BILA|nr:hypothetical protein DdX_19639 [Ditylenchus destructor]